MSSTVTISPEELQFLNSFQTRFRRLTSQYGEAFFQQKLINAELKELENQMDILENDRIGYLQELQKKYGIGTVNIMTGEFTPSVPEPVSPPNQNV